MFQFKDLTFEISDDKIYLARVGNIAVSDGNGFCEVQIAGENKNSHLGVKMINSSEGGRLKYVSHEITDGKLEILQKSELVEVTTRFVSHTDSNAFQVTSEVKNISHESIVLEEVSSFVMFGIGSLNTADKIKLTRFFQSHHTECQPETHTLSELGLIRGVAMNQARVAFCNVGSWSTKEALPQCIIHDGSSGESLMFQIESNNSWYYEIGSKKGKYYLYLGGANATHGGWSKKLGCGEVYKTVPISIALGNDLNSLLGEMTKHRRHLAGKCLPDENLPSIFNEYMHLSWDNPTAENTKKYAPTVADLGIQYYVIDCGWHNEENGNIIYPYVGQWMQSNKRFPDGVRATTDYIRSLGMKAGLWIEPEIIGFKCADMIDYYDDDCFLQRHGKRICTMNRYFLDYRHPKVIDYMTETIRRMVEDYGADYIKMDFNEDCGIGTDLRALTPGEGLESHARAYLAWVDSVRKRFPQVLFETCSSGGMRMDYGTLSHFSIVSTSDQTSYLRYPYIAGNILSAVIPEQAAVWSYPVGTDTPGFTLDREWVNNNISDEQIIMNMVNSFLGRMHLASHLELLDKDKLSLIKEGIEYYNSISANKKQALPYLPFGFTKFGKGAVASGLITDKKLFLAVWNLGGERELCIPLSELSPKTARISYPRSEKYEIGLEISDGCLKISFTEDRQARMLEIELS